VSRFVVTGAAGFIGSHLAEALARAGHDVVAVDCFTPYYDVALKEANAREAGLEPLRLDLADDPLEDVVVGADGIFHLAAQTGVRYSFAAFELYARWNLLATQRVLAAAAAAGVRVVFASSSSVYGEAEAYPTPEEASPRPISPYGITKLGCEHLARAYAVSHRLDAVALRYFTVYGPRQRPDMAFTPLLDALATGRPFRLLGDGSASRSFTYVADAVAATVAAMERAPAGAIVNVGGGEEATMNEVLRLAEDIAGRPLTVERLPAAPGDVRRTKADTALARRLLGWEPTTSLAEGLRVQWEWASARVAAG
jgi:nucleoside-diphosphate-sugar epimerase